MTATDNLLEKGAAWLFGTETDLQKQEREATERAQQAKQVYDSYSHSVDDTNRGIPYYPKAPQTTFDPGPGGGGPNPTVNSPMGTGRGGSPTGATTVTSVSGSAASPLVCRSTNTPKLGRVASGNSVERVRTRSIPVELTEQMLTLDRIACVTPVTSDR